MTDTIEHTDTAAVVAEVTAWLEENWDPDLRVAEWATYAFPGEGLIARCPLFRRFREHFALEAGSLPNLERFLAPWNERLA